jgi:hypothetical protein
MADKPTHMPLGRGLGYSLRLLAALLTWNWDAAENTLVEVESFWAGNDG